MEQLEAEYEGKMYGHLKVDLAEVVADIVTPIRDRTNELLADPAELDRLLALGADKAREIASVTLGDVYATWASCRPGASRESASTMSPPATSPPAKGPGLHGSPGYWRRTPHGGPAAAGQAPGGRHQHRRDPGLPA